MPRLFAAFVLACIIVSSASAQIIYEPVQYQYGGTQAPFYYGGNDPDMFRFAEREYALAHSGFAMAHGDVTQYYAVDLTYPHVYIDQLPRTNAAIYGYNANDARNDAYANAARYFTKRGAMHYAVQDETGAWHIPPQVSGMHSGTIEIKPYVRPTVAPSPVIVIPKDMLDRKIVPDAPQKVANAQ
jgi:hypothetical protein